YTASTLDAQMCHRCDCPAREGSPQLERGSLRGAAPRPHYGAGEKIRCACLGESHRSLPHWRSRDAQTRMTSAFRTPEPSTSRRSTPITASPSSARSSAQAATTSATPGRTERVRLRCPSANGRYPPADFARDLTGRTFEKVTRRGKFLEFWFEGESARLVVNPMLGGRFAFCTRAAPAIAATCFTLQLSGAMDLRFVDAVQMARVYLT